MSPRRMRQVRHALSSRSYLLILLLAILLAFGLVASNLYERVQDVKEVTRAETRKAAERELTRAIQTVTTDAEALATDLARWGEVHQQLNSPQYYSYWREQRLVSARLYPAYVAGVELYDVDGHALAPVIGSALPNRKGEQARYVERINNQLYLVTFAPVGAGQDDTRILGYVGMLWEFVPAALLLGHFTALDSATLGTKPGPDARLPIDRLPGLLHYDAQTNPAASKMEAVVNRSMVEFAIILGGLLILVYFGVSRLMITPLQSMARRVGQLRTSTDGPVIGAEKLVSSRLVELNSLSDVLQQYHRELAATSQDLDRTHQELWNLAHSDALTGAHNRRAFDSDWHALLETAQDRRLDVAFLLFDCDFFKAINDTYGHSTGDRLVQSLSRVLQQALRKGDKLYRLGGDEFAAVLINADRGQAQHVAERCLERIAQQPFHEIGIKEAISISVGVAVSDGTQAGALARLPRQADLAMYEAKRNRHRKIIHYDPSMDRESGSLVSSRAVTAAVAAAQGDGGIEMHYQPIVSATTGQVKHYEALVRVRDAEGLLFPSELFPIIDQRGLHIPFDLSIVRSIQADIEAHHLPRGVGISINLSAHALMKPRLLSELEGLLPLLDRHPIIIEVTETDLITQMQFVTDNITALRRHGALIALDDFGSGYSSIRYLASMPVDIVKFDVDMIRDLESEASRRSIVENAARLVREAGYELIAEGIETEGQRVLATDMGATHLQGYLFGKPCRVPRPASVSHTG